MYSRATTPQGSPLVLNSIAALDCNFADWEQERQNKLTQYFICIATCSKSRPLLCSNKQWTGYHCSLTALPQAALIIKNKSNCTITVFTQHYSLGKLWWPCSFLLTLHFKMHACDFCGILSRRKNNIRHCRKLLQNHLKYSPCILVVPEIYLKGKTT